MSKEIVKCEECGEEIAKEDILQYGGKILCEDCYIDEKMTLKACDPMGVRSAKGIEEMTGKSGVESLTEEQREIYEYIKSNHRATKEELANKFDLSEKEIENKFAILRRYELVKGKQINDKIYLVPFAE